MKFFVKGLAFPTFNALDHSDQEEAEKEIYEREGLEFDSGEDGSTLALLTQEYEQIKARYHASQTVLEQQETKLNNMPQYVKSPFLKRAFIKIIILFGLESRTVI